LERDGADVVVSDFYRRCAQDLHCTLVGTSCNGCCGRDAINSALVETYERESTAACDDFDGPVCRCMPQDLVARCAEGRCRAVARIAERDCFSPEQNAGRAFEPGEQGCPCALEGLSACSDGNALACVLDSAAQELKWTALPGGMCETSPECAAVSRRPTADACFSEYLQCNRREDGTFCGDQCHGPLDCSAISCADYEPPTPTTVSCDPTGGPWEGLCGVAGELRYRASRGTTGETRYWDAAGGKLLAVRISSDTQSFCNESEFDMVLGDVTVLQRCTVVTADHTDLCSPTRCNDSPATRLGDTCQFELGRPLEPATACRARVLLNGQDLRCNDPDGWTLVTGSVIELSGAACSLVTSSAGLLVEVHLPCNLLP
jgi:hypothetical protein